MPACAPCQAEYDPSRATTSATTMADVRSISMPPNFSGITTAGRPSLPDLRSTEIATPGSWCWIASMFGTTSLFQNSSVVRPIARCSSVKSSGVKTSSVVVGSIRNEPPLCRTGESVEVAINNPLIQLIQPFKNPRGALAAANTHRHHSVFALAPLHLAQNRRRQLRPRASQRMPQRDGAPVWIHPLQIEPDFTNHGQRLRPESFVQLHHADVFGLQSRQHQRFRDRDHRPDAHNLGRHAA